MGLPEQYLADTTANAVPAARLPDSALYPDGQQIRHRSSSRTIHAVSTSSARLRSLDAFRGLTIVLMLLVNNIALDWATPKQLQHAPWNAGITIADLVFPWFLFCVGAAIPFAAASFRRKGLPAWRYDVKVFGRTASLLLLGCLIDCSLQYHQQHRLLFTLGVLQLISLAYLVAALLYDLPLVRRMLIAAGMLISYWAALMFLPVPGVGAGMLSETNNLIWHLNISYLSAVNLWGLPSVIPTAALVLIGTAIGDLLRAEGIENRMRVIWLGVIGVALIALGFIWNLHLPFNKGLWTPAYILLTAGIGTLLLGLFYHILDVAHWWRWSQPLLVFGSNAILAYVAPILVKLWVFPCWRIGHAGSAAPIDKWLLNSAKVHFGLIAGGWLFTLGLIVVWWVILWQLHRHRLFLRV